MMVSTNIQDLMKVIILKVRVLVIKCGPSVGSAEEDKMLCF